MIINGYLGILLNSFSIIIISAVLIIALAWAAYCCQIDPLKNMAAEPRQLSLWTLACSPWLVGIISAVLVMSLSNPGTADYFNSPMVHWHHPAEFSLFSWHGYFVSLMLGLAFLKMLQLILQASRSANFLRTLTSMAQPTKEGVLMLGTDVPAAFTAGLKNPRCFMTTSLVDQLSERELSMVHLHEMAHIKKYDPLRKTLFHMLTNFFPPSLARTLNVMMSTAMEQTADNSVAEQHQDKAEIARVLLKVKQLAVHNFGDGVQYSQFCHYGLENIDQRIHYLLSDYKGKSYPLYLVIALVAALSIACAIGTDSIHHAIEISLEHI